MTPGQTRAEIKRILPTFTKAEQDRILRLIELTLDYVRFLEAMREDKETHPAEPTKARRGAPHTTAAKG